MIEHDRTSNAILLVRLAPFRDKSVDKWQRKTQVTTGVAAMKNKLQAFNQVFPYNSVGINYSQEMNPHMLFLKFWLFQGCQLKLNHAYFSHGYLAEH